MTATAGKMAWGTILAPWLRLIIGASLALSWAVAPAQTPADSFRKILPAIQLLLLSGEDRRGVYNIFTDHLNTPRLITKNNVQAIWKWDNNDPFSGNPPDENPSGLGAFTFDLGFPGQVRDRETGTFYNYFRDCYESATGRYCQPDPIGLEGGISLYLYGGGNPLSNFDRRGLETSVITVRDNGIGTHSAVHIHTPGKPPFIYDPGGSYIPRSGEPRGSGDFFEGRDASLRDFLRYHENRGSAVEITKLPTTPRQERELIRKAEQAGGSPPFFCTVFASRVLDGVCGIGRSFLPGGLASDAREAQCKP